MCYDVQVERNVAMLPSGSAGERVCVFFSPLTTALQETEPERAQGYLVAVRRSSELAEFKSLGEFQGLTWSGADRCSKLKEVKG